jgi:hypothetical protein
MKRTALVALAAGTMVGALAPSAQAAGWQPTSGSYTTVAVNPCTGQSTDFTFAWERMVVKGTKSGKVTTGLNGTYTASDGSSGTVHTTAGTTYTADGYIDTYRQLLVGRYEGHTQRVSFVFRIVVGAEDIDVKVQRSGASCG